MQGKWREGEGVGGDECGEEEEEGVGGEVWL